ncbi:twin-arginine translocase TatA/TatE family subunit [Suttonella sp. R2A3]|uniref:twin-arginine translocase TatA/TatE family subunit n=1 Tax=Suttonella sp. R2A3 TaxID=2908648 RepID=UPI0021A3FFE3|nr:twin-arginine translocase TatA/TatE family subunit [Suttonella sp. R2A3]
MGISPIQLLIVLVIVVLIFGGKRLRSLGSDLGHAIKGFKEVNKEDKEAKTKAQERVRHDQTDDDVIEGEVKKEDHTH